jgi:large subunit ribosomal protein L19
MSVIKEIEQSFKKPHVVDVKSGDVVRVHQKIREGGKERVQVFEGLVIRTKRKNSLSANITVRRIASGVGVEKTFLLHSPLVTKVEVVKRSKVRRNYLSYMRERTGKSARLSAVDFDQDKVNYVPEPEVKEVPEAAPEKPVEETKPEESKEKPANDEEKAGSKEHKDKVEAKPEEKPEEKK